MVSAPLKATAGPADGAPGPIISSSRHIILKALLGALALTALAGVMAVVASSDVVWRVFFTGLTAAIASVLILGVSPMLDVPSARSAGLAVTAGATVEFILFVTLIWELHRPLPGDESEILATAGVVALAAPATMGFLRMLNAPATRIAAVTGLAVVAAAGVTALVAVWWQGTGASWTSSTASNLWATAWAVCVLGLLAVSALVGAGSDRRRWRWAGVAAAVAALLIAVVDIWEPAVRLEELLAPLIAAASWVALANLLVRVGVPPAQGWLRLATLAAAGVTACLWVLVAWDVLDDDLAVRASASSTIPTGCGVLGLVIMARLHRRIDTAELPRELRQITLYCPRCAKKQTLPLGAAACAACNLKIEVRAGQPACTQCGYVLYGPAAQRCPECGTPVARPAEAA